MNGLNIEALIICLFSILEVCAIGWIGEGWEISVAVEISSSVLDLESKRGLYFGEFVGATKNPSSLVYCLSADSSFSGFCWFSRGLVPNRLSKESSTGGTKPSVITSKLALLADLRFCFSYRLRVSWEDSDYTLELGLEVFFFGCRS
jgi:hypothetical protein